MISIGVAVLIGRSSRDHVFMIFITSRVMSSCCSAPAVKSSAARKTFSRISAAEAVGRPRIATCASPSGCRAPPTSLAPALSGLAGQRARTWEAAARHGFRVEELFLCAGIGKPLFGAVAVYGCRLIGSHQILDGRRLFVESDRAPKSIPNACCRWNTSLPRSRIAI